MSMEFFVKVDDNPSSETYGQVQSLHRRTELGGKLFLERWDGKRKEWIDDPDLPAAIEDCDASGYKSMDRDRVPALIIELSDGPLPVRGNRGGKTHLNILSPGADPDKAAATLFRSLKALAPDDDQERSTY